MTLNLKNNLRITGVAYKAGNSVAYKAGYLVAYKATTHQFGRSNDCL